MIDRRKALALTVALVLFSSAFSFFAGSAGLFPKLSALAAHSLVAAPPSAGPSAAGLDYKALDTVRQEIDKNFLNPVPDDKLLTGALKGMVEATGDKYSAYYTPSEYKQFLDHFKSTLSGIGIYVELKDGHVTVVAPMKTSPGEKAGLRAGDVITAVDGKDITAMTIDEAVDLIRGPQGTQVKLAVQRKGTQEPLSFTITRATIEIPTVESKMVDAAHGVGYVQVLEFNEQVSDRIAKAMDDLKSQGMTKMILDLRQDPGGLLDEAIGTCSIFVPAKTPCVFVEGRKDKETYTSRGAKQKFDMPLVVLVDGGSASASEIVAGALKDLKIGVLMGTKTFGKGSVQTFHTLPDGAGIKLTIAHYLTAGGISINEKGIDPDIVKENPKDVKPGDPGDVQLQEAIKYVQTMKR